MTLKKGLETASSNEISIKWYHDITGEFNKLLKLPTYSTVWVHLVVKMKEYVMLGN